MKAVALSLSNHRLWQPKNSLPKCRDPDRQSPSPFHPNTISSLPSRRIPLPSLAVKASQNPETFPTQQFKSDQPPLVVVGSANADVFVEIERLPGVGETISAKSGQMLAGGKGANQAVCGAKLSYPAYFIGQVGDDSHGKLITDALVDGGVCVGHLRTVSAAPTGHAVVMLQPDGQNSIIIVGGANMACWPRSISEKDLDVVNNAGIVLLQREIPDSVNTLFAKAASTASVPVILDAGGMDAPLSQKLLNYVDILSPNESELARITGMETETFEQVCHAVRKCHGMGVKQVLVKLGARGSALFIEEEEPIEQPIITAAQVVDTTGAGDTFTAAFAVALLEGMPKWECLKFAAAAASLCVQVKGAIPGMPGRKSVLNLLQSL